MTSSGKDFAKPVVDLLDSKFNVSLAGIAPSTSKDFYGDLKSTKNLPHDQDLANDVAKTTPMEDDDDDDAYDPLKEYYKMMKEKLDK
jgi:hypothetical protein